MKTFLKAVAVAAVLAGPAAAQDQDAITGVIQDQIEAFLADDFDTAFTYASPGIKRMFGTADRFGLMVREGCRMVWRPADVQYLELRSEGGAPVQKVLITDQDGATHVLEYFMQPGDDGWQISGVRILRAPGVGA